MIAVTRLNNHTLNGLGFGGRLRLRFRRGCLMIVVGRKTSPAVVVCVFIVLFWFGFWLVVGECVDVVAMILRLVPSLI